jgi:hypothetical protein
MLRLDGNDDPGEPEQGAVTEKSNAGFPQNFVGGFGGAFFRASQRHEGQIKGQAQRGNTVESVVFPGLEIP